MKKFLAFLLMAIMLVTAFTACDESRDPEDDAKDNEASTSSEGLEFEITSDLKGYKLVEMGDCTSSKIVIDTYEGLPVTEIAQDALKGYSGITSIKISDSVTKIGANAFLGTGYYNDESNWENGLLYIDNHLIKADKDSASGKCTVKKGTKTIASRAFYDCSKITSVSMPNTVINMGTQTFINCSGLTKITLSSKLTDIGEFTFEGCSSLSSISIPESVKDIGISAFNGCSNLTSISIPKGVKAIKSGTFRDCTKLKSVSMPKSITSIDSAAFKNCLELTDITLSDNITSIRDYAFDNCKALTSITIPDGVTSIGDSAFENCSGLTSITIPDKVTTIEYNTFCKCSKLTAITIPSSVTSIGVLAFYDCESLTEVEFQNTEGWTAGDTEISSSDLADASKAAKYLTDTYDFEKWSCNK